MSKMSYEVSSIFMLFHLNVFPIMRKFGWIDVLCLLVNHTGTAKGIMIFGTEIDYSQK